MITKDPRYRITINLLTKDTLKIEDLNEEATKFRDMWHKEKKQIDSEILFYTFLVHTSSSSTAQVITKTSITYEITVDHAELNLNFQD